MLTATNIIKRVRGGSQARIVTANDGQMYVVKVQNNPQHTRVLANDLIAARLASKIGLPVPEGKIVELSVDLAHEWRIELADTFIEAQPGPCFGSLYQDHGLDFLPDTLLPTVKNLTDFVGVLAFDKWICNADGRQVVFAKAPKQRKYRAHFIDFGYAFNAGEWTFPDAPLRGVFMNNSPYHEVTGWESFEPWLSRIEEMSIETIAKATADVPTCWYDDEEDVLNKLVLNLYERRKLVRSLIDGFRNSSRRPFPNWKEAN
jgi:hypothetical protein